MSNEGRRWFEQRKEFVAKPRDPEVTNESPDLFTRCPECAVALFNETLREQVDVCMHCGFHFRVNPEQRLALLCDDGKYEEYDQELHSVDILGFVDSKPYPIRIAASAAKTGRNDACYSVSAEICGVPVEIAVFDFRYMGGSMGSVVGEVLTRMFERAIERKRPAIVISASGGARMQEGVLSLMQMAKTCAALANLKDVCGMPYISVLTHPTTGGVAASFAMLGDVIIAEPGALIGFAGARVIKETIGQDLPDGFQTSEYLLAHGMVDMIVERSEMRVTIGRLLRMLVGEGPLVVGDSALNSNAGEKNAVASSLKKQHPGPAT